jgi:hypothetical protein
MKNSLKYLSVIIVLITFGCTDIIDLKSESNISVENFYANYTDLQVGLTSCYKGMQAPLSEEWSMTELRSDNTVENSGTSTSTVKHDLTYLDQFYPPTTHQGVYTYWLQTYNNIRNTNIVLNAAGANYNETSTAIEYEPVTIPVTLAQCKSIAAEASFIRAYHYFNLVRLFGGVFLIHEPITPEQAKQVNRASVTDMYKLIEADLKNAITNGISTAYSANSSDLGHANKWAAEALLAKVYLTLNRKAEASILLQDVINNSGYSLQSTYANVFSVNNEMNSELLFAIRFKGGGLGMGNPLPNNFAPVNSGNAVINGDGDGYNAPALEIIKTSSSYTSYIDPSLARYNVNISSFTKGNAATSYFVNKYMSPTIIAYDAESDWPVLRYADVILMKAEADGNVTSSLGYINQVRLRAGLTALTATSVNTTANFEKALATERRWEFAFENQRWFDLLRYSTTTTTLSASTDQFPGLKVQGAEYVMKKHLNNMWSKLYSGFTVLPIPLSQLLSNANPDRFLLPIPQYEIDTNSFITIQQNPSY